MSTAPEALRRDPASGAASFPSRRLSHVVYPSQTPEYRRAKYLQRTMEERDAINARRRAQYAAHPELRARRQAMNRVSSTPEKEKARRDRSLVNAAKAAFGKCMTCHYDRHVGALQWHHVDPDQKLREPSSLRRASDIKSLDELRKCVLLCSNCHWEVTHGKRQIDSFLHLMCSMWISAFALERAEARG